MLREISAQGLDPLSFTLASHPSSTLSLPSLCQFRCTGLAVVCSCCPSSANGIDCATYSTESRSRSGCVWFSLCATCLAHNLWTCFYRKEMSVSAHLFDCEKEAPHGRQSGAWKRECTAKRRIPDDDNDKKTMWNSEKQSELRKRFPVRV
jgi:hypothetical protein